MSNDNIKRLRREDFPDQGEWIEKLLHSYNQMADAISGPGDSSKIEFIEATITAAGDGVDTDDATQSQISDLNSALDGKLSTSGGTITGSLDVTGQISSPLVRATGGGDVSLSSTTHAFQAGETSTINIVIDGNEIQARNNGAASTLNLNVEGGQVVVGSGGLTVTESSANCSFTVYGIEWSGNGPPVVRKRGNLVHITGFVRTNASIAANDGKSLLTIPVGYRPVSSIVVTTKAAAGTVNILYHSDGRVLSSDASDTIATANWIKVHACWMTS